MRQIQVQVDFQDDYRISEAFKTLRTNIRFCGANNKVIMVTSCLQSDGKTTVSFGIAKAFADDGQKVLLLDTDLRKSVMSRRLLGEDISLGTTSVLSQTNSFLVMARNPIRYGLSSHQRKATTTPLNGEKDSTRDRHLDGDSRRTGRRVTRSYSTNAATSEVGTTSPLLNFPPRPCWSRL